MLGDIELDPDLSARLPPDLARQLQTVDSLITLRDWDGALAQLRRMRSPEDSEVTAVVEEYTGFCYLPTWPDHTLHSYRRAMSADSGDDSTRQFRLAFAAGYLFQMYGFPDSALAEYSTARSWAPSGSDEWALHSDEDVGLPISQRLLMPALYNNLALAYELTGDTAAALSFYDSAALLVDTTRDVPSARTVRGNLRRLEH